MNVNQKKVHKKLYIFSDSCYIYLHALQRLFSCEWTSYRKFLNMKIYTLFGENLAQMAKNDKLNPHQLEYFSRCAKLNLCQF